MFNENENIKAAALSYAIKSCCGTEYNEFGHATTNARFLIEAAKIIETYLKGTDND